MSKKSPQPVGTKRVVTDSYTNTSPRNTQAAAWSNSCEKEIYLKGSYSSYQHSVAEVDLCFKFIHTASIIQEQHRASTVTNSYICGASLRFNSDLWLSARECLLTTRKCVIRSSISLVSVLDPRSKGRRSARGLIEEYTISVYNMCMRASLRFNRDLQVSIRDKGNSLRQPRPS